MLVVVLAHFIEKTPSLSKKGLKIHYKIVYFLAAYNKDPFAVTKSFTIIII